MSALVLKDVSKSFEDVHAVKKLSLSVNQGDFFALLGPNGAGKSTLINMISTLILQDSGQISIFENDTITSSFQAKRFLGVVPQEFNFSIFDKVIDIIVNQAGFYGIERATALIRAEHLLKQLNLWDKRDSQARMLSGGMKRRLMICRALVHHPKILILDEPTAGVDIEIRRHIWQFLTKINQEGMTIILTTHYLEEVEMLCHNMAIIEKGQVLKRGSVRQLISSIEEQTFVCDLSPSTIPVSGLTHHFERLTWKDNQTLEITITSAHSINDIFTFFTQKGIEVLNMRPKNNRLEDLFLKLTYKESSSDV